MISYQGTQQPHIHCLLRQ